MKFLRGLAIPGFCGAYWCTYCFCSGEGILNFEFGSGDLVLISHYLPIWPLGPGKWENGRFRFCDAAYIVRVVSEIYMSGFVLLSLWAGKRRLKILKHSYYIFSEDSNNI